MLVKTQLTQNNFGFLRLFFALLVIFSHSPEAIDGNRHRELLVRIFGTMSLGDLAVDGFFMISGYLILMSYQHSSTLKSFLVKRILRIYPGFVVAYIFCFFCVIPLAQSFEFLFENHNAWFWFKSFFRMLVLDPAYVEGVFDKTPFPYLDSPMWTIKYEFFCYLMVPLLFYFLKGNVKFYAAIFLSLLIGAHLASIYQQDFILPKPIDLQLTSVLRLVSSFLMGSIFYLLRDKIVFNPLYTLMSIICIIGLLFSQGLSHVGLTTFGAYLLFNFALNYKSNFLSKVGTKVDLSYGIYLYAWPIQNLMIQHNSAISATKLTLITILLSSILAFISWTFIEKPFMNMKRKFV
jgi:peptidoglycan/LPS O-acetylase OafA/YrhL